jgi:hypothetical protein
LVGVFGQQAFVAGQQLDVTKRKTLEGADELRVIRVLGVEHRTFRGQGGNGAGFRVGFSLCADVDDNIDVNEPIHDDRSPLISSRRLKASIRSRCFSVNSGRSSSGGRGAFLMSAICASKALARSITSCGMLHAVSISISSSGTVTKTLSLSAFSFQADRRDEFQLSVVIDGFNLHGFSLRY